MDFQQVRGSVRNFKQSYELEVELEWEGEGEWVCVPAGCSTLAVGVVPNAGAKARVETTLATAEELHTGKIPSEFIFPWDLGDVEAAEQDQASAAITALRLVCTGGGGKLRARAV